MRYIHSRTLSEWLDFTHETIMAWARRGQLDRHVILTEVHHSEESVNELLTHAARGTPSPLTVADFRAGVRLIDLSTAASVLSITTHSLHSKIARKRFGGLRFGNEWRFADREVYDYFARRNGYLNRDDVCHIFGCSYKIVRRWDKEGVLRPTPVDGAGQWRFYYRPADVRGVIRQCLPADAPDWQVEQWLFEACVSPQPPMRPIEAAAILGLQRRELDDMAHHGLLHLRFPEKRFTRVTIERMLLKQKPWTPQDIGHAIGADAEQVVGWLRKALACRIHNHRDLQYRYACMVTILEPMLSPGLTARNWLMGRERSPNLPLFTDEEVATRYKVSVDDIVLLATVGALGGLRRPDGVWIFTESRLRMTHAELREHLAVHK